MLGIFLYNDSNNRSISFNCSSLLASSFFSILSSIYFNFSSKSSTFPSALSNFFRTSTSLASAYLDFSLYSVAKSLYCLYFYYKLAI